MTFTLAYSELPAHVDLPALDREVIRRWRSARVFERSLAQTASGPSWIFYEGPPTANGMPGAHHVEARVFKDVFPRFKTMKGFHVERRAGWDCHGLPVEIAVEKELGFSGKADIENYGVAEFNSRCREAVQRHVEAFEQLSERMGYWADYQNAYWTMHSDYVQSVWWALKHIHDRGLLVEDFRVAPYCTRCGTGLSDHEMGQEGVYREVVDPSVYVRLPLTSGPHAGAADLLIWTTTPWTLPSNALVAAKDDVLYTIASNGNDHLVVAKDLVGAALGEGWTTDAEFTGSDMVGWRYRRPLDIVEWSGPGHFVVVEEYVTTDHGTGLVHEATVYGADDMDSVRRNGVALINPIATDGRFRDDIALVGGMFFKDADETIMAELKQQGTMFRDLPYVHSYPHCWRCDTPLMYYALPSWYIRTTEIKDELLAQNEATNWFPETIKHGRYGDWLKNNVDWALSRDRYWGTPLPIWRSDVDASKSMCIGSLAELAELSGVTLNDPHRPFVDDVTFTVEGNPGVYRRVPQVIDAWFDSGAMPFAQFGAPWHNAELAVQSYPADFICEAIDQTRGWFYSLMAVGTLVKGQSSYRNALCLGHILAEDGRKMSKHIGNVLEPIPLMERHGADALRWFMLAGGSPWSARRVSHKVLEEIANKVLRTYWSVAAFQSLYARVNGWTLTTEQYRELTLLDRWAVSEAHQLVRDVDAALEAFDTQLAGKLLAEYIDSLSNWYVRRSRRRFWEGDLAAFATLHECLSQLTRLLAPFVPFVADQVWSALFAASTEFDSVHLASWPVADEAAIDAPLSRQMSLVRRLVQLGREARAKSTVKTRQPLGRALVSAPEWDELPDQLREDIRAELNVDSLDSLLDAGEVIDVSVKPNFRVLGKRFGPRMREVAASIASYPDLRHIPAMLKGSGQVVIDGESYTEDDLIVTQAPASGWAVASDGPDTVALDLELTRELRMAGLARELTRLIQNGRKDAGLDVTDRIELFWRVGDAPELAEAIRAYGERIAGEVLATTFTEAPAGSVDCVSAAPCRPAMIAAARDGIQLPDDGDGGFARLVDEELGIHAWLRKA